MLQWSGGWNRAKDETQLFHTERKPADWLDGIISALSFRGDCLFALLGSDGKRQAKTHTAEDIAALYRDALRWARIFPATGTTWISATTFLQGFFQSPTFSRAAGSSTACAPPISWERARSSRSIPSSTLPTAALMSKPVSTVQSVIGSSRPVLMSISVRLLSTMESNLAISTALPPATTASRTRNLKSAITSGQICPRPAAAPSSSSVNRG